MIHLIFTTLFKQSKFYLFILFNEREQTLTKNEELFWLMLTKMNKCFNKC